MLKRNVSVIQDIDGNNIVVYIGSDLPKEYSGSKYTNKIKGTNAKAKANAVTGLPEMIEIAVGRYFKENHEDKHRRDAKNGWYRYDSRFALPVYDTEGELERYNIFHASIRNDGASISEIVGIYLGPIMKNVMRIFSAVLLVMVGVVFMVGPAGLLALLTPNFLNVKIWTIVILIYYFLATILPIDKIIGKVYPIFGICLIVMAAGIGIVTIYRHVTGVAPGLHFMRKLVA